MITAVDVQYEPRQQKIGFFGRTLVLVAGDIAVHSQAVQDTEKEVEGRLAGPQEIAQIYGSAIQAINRRHAENEILAPLGLNAATFHAQQNQFSESFVNSIASQLQNRRPIDVEALVVGPDGQNAHIYQVDCFGNSICLDGVGFGAIGIGAWHAKSRLMQIGHVNTRIFAPALAAIFASKRNAEIAPGVGSQTDLHIVLRGGPCPVGDVVQPELDRLYKKYSAEVVEIGNKLVAELQEFIDSPRAAPAAAGDDVQSNPVSTAMVVGDEVAGEKAAVQ
jgi:hypothetical protein